VTVTVTMAWAQACPTLAQEQDAIQFYQQVLAQVGVDHD